MDISINIDADSLNHLATTLACVAGAALTLTSLYITYLVRKL